MFPQHLSIDIFVCLKRYTKNLHISDLVLCFQCCIYTSCILCMFLRLHAYVCSRVRVYSCVVLVRECVCYMCASVRCLCEFHFFLYLFRWRPHANIYWYFIWIVMYLINETIYKWRRYYYFFLYFFIIITITIIIIISCKERITVQVTKPKLYLLNKYAHTLNICEIRCCLRTQHDGLIHTHGTSGFKTSTNSTSLYSESGRFPLHIFNM